MIYSMTTIFLPSPLLFHDLELTSGFDGMAFELVPIH